MCVYILTISRSSLSMKMIGSKSRSNEENVRFYPSSNFYMLVFHQSLHKISMSSEGQGHSISII